MAEYIFLSYHVSTRNITLIRIRFNTPIIDDEALPKKLGKMKYREKENAYHS